MMVDVKLERGGGSKISCAVLPRDPELQRCIIIEDDEDENYFGLDENYFDENARKKNCNKLPIPDLQNLICHSFSFVIIITFVLIILFLLLTVPGAHIVL